MDISESAVTTTAFTTDDEDLIKLMRVSKKCCKMIV